MKHRYIIDAQRHISYNRIINYSATYDYLFDIIDRIKDEWEKFKKNNDKNTNNQFMTLMMNTCLVTLSDYLKIPNEYIMDEYSEIEHELQ